MCCVYCSPPNNPRMMETPLVRIPHQSSEILNFRVVGLFSRYVTVLLFCHLFTFTSPMAMQQKLGFKEHWQSWCYPGRRHGGHPAPYDRMDHMLLFFKMHVSWISSPEYQAFVIRTCLLFFNRVPSVQLLFPFMYDPNPLPRSPQKNISLKLLSSTTAKPACFFFLSEGWCQRAFNSRPTIWGCAVSSSPLPWRLDLRFWGGEFFPTKNRAFMGPWGEATW